MSYLGSISLINDLEETIVDAFVITPEISLLLMQEGIEPSTVNKLKVPAGLSRVGTFTILCHLPPDWTLDEGEEVWARVGPLKWRLSSNYRLKRIFPNSVHENGIINTLSVISFDDWRYELNLNNSGSQEAFSNVYQNDWRVYPSTEQYTKTESEGLDPISVGRLNDERLHLHVKDIPSLTDTWNAWDYKTKLSDAKLADKVLSSCGMVAVPYPMWCEKAEEYQSEPQYNTGASSEDYMVTEYIGDGWDGGITSWNRFVGQHMNGQLQCAFGNPEEYNSALDADDDMLSHIQSVPEDSSSARNWVAHPKDGTQEIPIGLDIQFPAKSEGGNIILYVFESVTHGKPSEDNEFFTYADEIQTLTDHIKTKCTGDFEEDSLNKDGITRIVINSSNYEDVPGLSEERARELARRALHISRCYYARYFACTGVWETMGFNLMKPFSGMLEVEYYLVNGVPRTKVSGSLDDERFGFNLTDLTENTILSSGGVMLTRPDGMSDIALRGGVIGNIGVFPVQVVDYVLDTGGCLAKYVVKNLTNDVFIPELTPWREIRPVIVGGTAQTEPVCYFPAQVGSIGLMGVHPDYDPANPFTNKLYFLILNEAVQTKSCS
jgi:hypothetical protein